MFASDGLTTGQVLTSFTAVIANHGGKVTEAFEDGRRSFARSILPHVDEVRPHDHMQGGIALKSDGGEIKLYPYLFRLVCKNGAILAHSLGECYEIDSYFLSEDEVSRSLQEAVETLGAEEVFAANMSQIRSSCQAEADMMLNLMPLLSRFPAPQGGKVLSDIMGQFLRERDTSRFGLANAVTAIARDTRDPELRWNLEEFGGGVAVGVTPKQPSDSGASDMSSSELVAMRGF